MLPFASSKLQLVVREPYLESRRQTRPGPLAFALEGRRAVEDALPAWETAMRMIADNSQRWALRYDLLTRCWPRPLWFMRPAVLWAFRSIPALGRRMRTADQGVKLIPRQLLTEAGPHGGLVRARSGGGYSAGA